MLLSELSQLLGGVLEGAADFEVTGIAPIDTATPTDLTFASRGDVDAMLRATRAGCVLVGTGARPRLGLNLIRVADPRLAFARAMQLLAPAPPRVHGVHPSACVHATARLGARVAVGPFCSVGAGAVLGDDVVLGARVSVHDGVTIGPRTVVGDGSVLGGSGFGFVKTPAGYEAMPQLGGLVIGADVAIGANATIDRGTLTPTRIGDGSKLDSQVHIGHNCQLGRHVVIAAQTGIAGGARVGDWALIGGQVGIGDRAEIGAGARLGAASAVPTGKRVPSGATFWGVPARPLRDHLRALASLARVAALRRPVSQNGDRCPESVGHCVWKDVGVVPGGVAGPESTPAIPCRCAAGATQP